MRPFSSPLPRMAIPWRPVATGGLGLLAIAALAALLFALGLRGDRLAVVVIVGLCLWCWATAWLPDLLVSLLLFFLLGTCTTLGPGVIFSGFASGAFWLVFSGAVLGLALTATGLGDRVAASLVARCGASYPRALAGFVAIAFLLSAIMPSTLGRIAILVPIVLRFADWVGLAAGRPGRSGLVLATALASCELSSAILPANLPNLVMAGSAEAILGLRLSYPDYAMLLLPALVVLRGALLVGAGLLLFPDRPEPLPDPSPAARLSPSEIRLLALLAGTLLLWLAEPWHGVAAGWVGLGAAILCLGPARLVATEQFLRSVKLQPLWFVAAIVGLTAAVDQSGLAAELGPWLRHIDIAALPPFIAYAALVVLSIGLTFAVTSNAAPALYTPLVPQLAAASGLAVKPVLLAQAIGFSTIALPYQAPPLVLAMALAGIGLRDGSRYCLLVAGLSLVSVVPLNFAWWRLLGIV
ncbi:MAG TPA: SLC13 family permease [Roseomonas sp.]|jgi:di/tricarboxylate transporter